MEKKIIRQNLLLFTACFFLISFLPARAAGGLLTKPDRQVPLYTVFELHMEADDPGENPWTDGPDVSAVFQGPGGQSFRIKGYWDGESVFSIRFAPQEEGRWTWTTHSADPGLNGIRGSFRAVASSRKAVRNNPLRQGFLEAAGYGWKLSDGTPFLPVGDTQWSFTEEFHTGEWKEWVQALKDRGFNTFLGCIWLGIYDRAGIKPFFGAPADGKFNEPFFDRLDEWVRIANEQGIMMGLTIGGFPENSGWFSYFPTKASNDRWFRYCVRRYAAFNVRWVLYGEVNETAPSWAGWVENTKAMAQLIKEEDPYNHPVGSHHTSIDRKTATGKNIDYLCVQIFRSGGPEDNDQYQLTSDYRQYKKPLWFEEYWYESIEGLEPGIQNTYRNFIAGLAFPTMGSLMRGHEMDAGFVPAMARRNKQTVYEYLMEHDKGLRCMQYFKAFVEGLDILQFTPAADKIVKPDRNIQCGRFGNEYLIFSEQGGDVCLDLTNASGTFRVTAMNIITGKKKQLAPISGGNRRVIELKDDTDVVLRISGGRINE